MVGKGMKLPNGITRQNYYDAVGLSPAMRIRLRELVEDKEPSRAHQGQNMICQALARRGLAEKVNGQWRATSAGRAANVDGQ
jgi:hypothetical protein